VNKSSEHKAAESGALPHVVKDALIGTIVCVPEAWTVEDITAFLYRNAVDASKFLGVQVTWRERRRDEANGMYDFNTVPCTEGHDGFVHRVFMRDEACEIVRLIDEVMALPSGPAGAAGAMRIIAKLDVLAKKNPIN
jgi:hypothetical protein